MRPIDEIIVHCTATPEGRAVSVKEIDSWHRARGWSGIGYHRVVHLDGTIEDGRAVGKVGAHVAGRNSRTIGIAYVGGVAADGTTPKDTRTEKQKSALRREIISLMDHFPAIGKVSGHRDYAAKACPSFDATGEYATARSRAENVPAVGDEMLRRGDRGADVLSWTHDLAAWRRQIRHPWPLRPTDAFDHTVELVTIEFQKSRGIVADGIVGPQAHDEMSRALQNLPPFQAMPRAEDDIVFNALRSKLEEAIALLANR